MARWEFCMMMTRGWRMPCSRRLSAAGLEGVRRNYPYGPQDGVTHTLKKHGLTRQIANVMLEIRNDLISDADGQAEWAERIAGLLKAALAELNAQKGQLHA
jgi:predicted N-formylglutamate amidohydrolase